MIIWKLHVWKAAAVLGMLGSYTVLAQSGRPADHADAQDDSALIDELVLANHILSKNGVLDAYGHVSVRSRRNPNHFYLARHLAANVVTRADILEYDFDSNPVDGNTARGYSERFIHGQIYRARPDVMAVVHCHPPEVIAFSVTNIPLRPLTHMGAFLRGPVPVFEIRNAGGMTDMLIRDNKLGRALAETLGDHDAALLRGHGAVVVGPSLHVVAGRSYYMIVNARVEQEAILMSGGKVTYLEPEEARKAAPQDGFERAWALWKQEVTGQ
jgi:ribulose-5-phosphate 4-epimerase/fuculose-1-phosphate aldolase